VKGNEFTQKGIEEILMLTLYKSTASIAKRSTACLVCERSWVQIPDRPNITQRCTQFATASTINIYPSSCMMIVVVVLFDPFRGMVVLPDPFRRMGAQRNSAETQQSWATPQGLDQRSIKEQIFTAHLAGSSGWCSPHSSSEWWAEMARQLYPGVRPMTIQSPLIGRFRSLPSKYTTLY